MESFRPVAPLDRRRFLVAVGTAVGSLVGQARPERARAAPDGFVASRSITSAMHVHASWSEGTASWEAQFDQASRLGVDVLEMTDHDYRALAHKYLPDLRSARYEVLSTGTAAHRHASRDGGSFRLQVESAGTGPATSGLQIEPSPMALNRLRTNIGGTTLHHAFGPSHLPPGALYEVVVGLSRHPASGVRPEGELSLRYRFSDGLAPGRSLEGGGLVGVVRAPTPGSGGVVTLTPTDDIAALWPDVLPVDNGLVSLAFLLTSPRRRVGAEVTAAEVLIRRTQSDRTSIRRNQQRIVQAYASRYPALTARPRVEVGTGMPHLNLFGVPAIFLDPADTLPDTYPTSYPGLVSRVHEQGGAVSYNHALGFSGGPLLSPSAQAAWRRHVFAEMWQHDAFGADVLEVAYAVRGGCSIDTHLDLWDTFSRRARFFTGNGVNDDHQGQDWAALGNGFATGLWATSTRDEAVVPALRGGRAYAKLLGQWAEGEIDVLVDGAVPMGAAHVSRARTRSLALYVGAAPRGGTVELVQGLVDHAGHEPRTTTVHRFPGSAFLGGSHVVAKPVDTTTSSFVRAVVRDAQGTIVGVGNPVWLLREVPPGGIPAARRV